MFNSSSRMHATMENVVYIGYGNLVRKYDAIRCAMLNHSSGSVGGGLHRAAWSFRRIIDQSITEWPFADTEFLCSQKKVSCFCVFHKIHPNTL